MTTNRTSLARLGLACLFGGLLFALSLWAMVFKNEFPAPVQRLLTTGVNWPSALFFLAQVGLMGGLYGLLTTRALGRAGALLVVPLLGVFCYGATAILPVDVVMTVLPQPLPKLGAILNCVGMLLVGIAVRRAKTWRGWGSWVALSIGVYPLVVMFPVLLATGHPPRLLIGGWGLLWAWLGYAIWQRSRQKTSVAELNPAGSRFR